MKQFHPLTVRRVDSETPDSLRISLDVPGDLAEQYRFLPGQHLPFEITIDGRKLRRTYSICSGAGDAGLQIGVRVQPGGLFSGYAAASLAAGDTLDAMPPSGRFHVDLDPGNAKDYVGFAAGSGITPILSMVKSVLESEPGSRFLLFYGNRKQSTTMFIDDLYALKNRFPERLQLHFLFSREDQEFAISAGRLDEDKVRELWRSFRAGIEPADVFVCGPGTMIQTVTGTLAGLGFDPDHIHSERFGVPRKGGDSLLNSPREDGTPGGELSKLSPRSQAHAAVTIIMDGHRREFEMQRADANIVDAAAGHGIDLPYSCKGGVCATCRCHLREGEVTMAANYGLEPWEVEAGYVLACQSTPVSDRLVLDYDKP